jgi:hypothetical protein
MYAVTRTIGFLGNDVLERLLADLKGMGVAAGEQPRHYFLPL